ncbi:MAG: protein kinase [Aridibacter famidurans]|nr:protein kinase [Aridibacter famidurans]
MTPERWKRITEVYNSALEFEPGAREDYLEQACGEDTTLRREVESLLDADASAGDFISDNAYRRVGEILGDQEITLAEGKEIGHYTILRKIGIGGMGEVYLAHDNKLNRNVAVKTLPLYFAVNSDYLRRFQTEVKATASLNHPNVATVYSVEEVDGLPFFTMEYVEGEPLNALFKKGPLGIELFLDIFIDLAEALAHAHRKGVVHRDIKPGNIIIEPDGNPKVLDFGLALLDRKDQDRPVSGSSITMPGQVLGTPAYMSPEQAEGKPVDQRSDIFSLGIVMYEAITGERPFKGENYASIVSKVLKEEPVSVTDLKPSVPFLLSRLIKRCLEKSTRKRFQSMDEVRVILEEVRAAVKAGISMDPSSADRRVTGRRKGRWQYVIVPAGFLAAIAIIFGIAYFGSPAPGEEYRLENFSFRRLSQTNNVVYAGVSPNGTSVAYNTIEPNGDRSLWIRLADDRNALRLVDAQDVHYWGGLTFSHDGSQIYYITAKKDALGGTMYRISAIGGAPRKLIDNVNDLGSLSPDGSRLLFVRYRDRMSLLSADANDGSNEKVILTGAANVKFRDPHFSADGTRIYLIKTTETKSEESWSLIEIPADGGDERVIIPDRRPRISEVVALKDGSGLLVNAVDPESNLAQLYFVNPATGTQTRITNDLNEYFGISVSDDGNTVVAAQRIDAKDIWVGEGSDFETYTKITSEPTFYLDLDWTPDGRIVFDSVDNNRPHIWIMDPDGSGRQQLTPGESNDAAPAVSRDGSRIYFMSDRSGEYEVWRMNIDGTEPAMLVDRPGVTENPMVAPDGKALYFECRKGDREVICRMDLANGTVTEREHFGSGRWAISPDGARVAYRYFDEQKARPMVGVRGFTATADELTFEISPVNVFQWSPDGKGLIYRDLDSGGDSINTIWFRPLDGGSPVPFVSSGATELYRLAISRDGKRNAIATRHLLTDAVMLSRRPSGR